MSAADSIYDQLEDVLQEAESQTKPLEIEPFRSHLFRLFAETHARGLTETDAEPDLSADGVCRELALRWGLTMAARDAVAQQTKLAPDQVGKMRLLRMWMEWTYAWNRWEDFHR